jgi:hypothetical protein
MSPILLYSLESLDINWLYLVTTLPSSSLIFVSHDKSQFQNIIIFLKLHQSFFYYHLIKKNKYKKKKILLLHTNFFIIFYITSIIFYSTKKKSHQQPLPNKPIDTHFVLHLLKFYRYYS